MTTPSSSSRLEQELYSLWEFIENGCDARPEDKHDALSTLDRIKLLLSETAAMAEKAMDRIVQDNADHIEEQARNALKAAVIGVGVGPATSPTDKKSDADFLRGIAADYEYRDGIPKPVYDRLHRIADALTPSHDTSVCTSKGVCDARFSQMQEMVKELDLLRSHVAALTPDWCMDAFWRANPGRNAVVPSLYLLDFAREVLRVHGVQSATAQRGSLADLVIRDVQELPDRTSPDDWPEAMLVTAAELRDIIERHA
jgi:hypothetical protein